MDRKGQIGFGPIIVAAVAILVGLAFYSGIFSDNVGTMTQTSASDNVTYTLPAIAGTTELTSCGQKALTYVVTNATSGAVVPTSNYTVTQAVGTDGYLAAKITTANSTYASNSVNVSCTFEPKGYIADGGSRGVVTLIAIFMALMIVAAALPDIRNGVIDFFNK